MFAITIEEIASEVNRVIDLDNVQDLYGPITRYYIDILRKVGNKSLFNHEEINNIEIKNGVMNLPDRVIKPESICIDNKLLNSSMYVVTGKKVRFTKNINGYASIVADTFFTNEDDSLVIFEVVSNALVNYAIYQELLVLASRKNKSHKVVMIGHYNSLWRTAIDEARAVLNKFTDDDYRMLFKSVRNR